MNTPAASAGSPSSRWSLRPGEMYRISYGVGASPERRVTRSVVVYTGSSERRRWDGRRIVCLEFALPRGRTLSLLDDQLVDARPALLNESGKLVLSNGDGPQRRRNLRRRRLTVLPTTEPTPEGP